MRISRFIGTNSFAMKMMTKYKLRPYRKEILAPLLVRGCTNVRKKTRIMQHKGICVISWGGSDTLYLGDFLSFVEYLKENEDRIFHVVHSHWCKVDLDHFDIPYIHRLIYPGIPANFPFEPETKGKVYHYGQPKRPWYYGTNLLSEIERRWEAYQISEKPEFIYTHHGLHDLPKLLGFYRDSLLGVRLTEHDGIAGSVIEMGLMGRRSIYNGNLPCAIHYMENPYTEYNPGVRHRWCYQKGDLVQIVGDLIQEELENRPMPDKLLAEEMQELVYDDEKWLNTKFYTG